MTTRRTRTISPSNAVETTNNPLVPTFTSESPSTNTAGVGTPDPNALPLAYPPLLFSHSIFLVALVFVLPMSSFLIPIVAENMPKRERGLDRPEPKWLEPITASPTLTLFWCVVGAGLLVSWWAGWMRQWVRDGRMGAGGGGVEERLDKFGKDGVSAGNGNARDYFSAWIFTIYTAVFYYVVLVLFGAPITSHTSQTSLLSLLLAVLTSFTPAYSLGPPSLSSTALQSLSHTAVFPLSLPIKVACFSLALVEDEALKGKEGASANARVVRNDTWIRLFAELNPQTPPSAALLYPSLGALVCAWLATIPLALDWDRPWQAYPLTTAYGAVGGYVLGGLGAFVRSWLKDIWREVREEQIAEKIAEKRLGGEKTEEIASKGRKKGKKN